MNENISSRILVIDDEEVVRESVRMILAPERVDHSDLQAFAADLFDETRVPAPWSSYRNMECQVDEASTGKIGLEMVRSALEAGRPYAVIFVDVRMPEWDGVETVQHLREVDREAEIIFLTAYSDSSIDEIVERAGPQVGYHLKPFAPEEIKQIATRAVYNWNKLRRLNRLIEAHRDAHKRHMASLQPVTEVQAS